MQPSAGGARRCSPEEARAAIERFLNFSRQPALIEPGEEPIPLVPGGYSLENRNGGLVLHAWSERSNVVRRVAGIHLEKPGRLELDVERFGKRLGRVYLTDLARPGAQVSLLRGERQVVLAQFRKSLARQFPGWKIAELSAEANLEYSLSPVYPRALLRNGQSGLAALACPRDAGHAAGALSFGLIWLDYLRHRERRLAVEGLALFIPRGLERNTCWRLRHMDPGAAKFRVFVLSPDGYEEEVDSRDYGNLDTRLEPCRTPAAVDSEADPRLARLWEAPYVERIPRNDGSLSFRVRGLEFARVAGGELRFGLDRKSKASASNADEIARLAAEVARLRSAGAADRENPLYRRNAECWLESQVRAHPEEIDAELAAGPVYGQVPAVAGVERGVLDLLAVERSGRLAVLELKAVEDIHLPIQALDYWMRVAWHAERGEFSALGYFPGVRLSNEPPRLLLVAPALDFHPATEVILRYFSPEICVERIGVGVEWRRRLQVMFRLRGAEKPR